MMKPAEDAEQIIGDAIDRYLRDWNETVQVEDAIQKVDGHARPFLKVYERKIEEFKRERFGKIQKAFKEYLTKHKCDFRTFLDKFHDNGIDRDLYKDAVEY